MEVKKSGQRISRTKKTIIVSAAIIVLCGMPAYADNIELPAQEEFSPAELNSTAKVNTTVSNNENTGFTPVNKIPIPETVNDFFAPTPDSSAAPEENYTDELNQPIKKTEEIIARETITKDTLTKEDSPFKSLDGVLSPSEYKGKKQAAALKRQNEVDGIPFKTIESFMTPSEYAIKRKTAEQNKVQSPLTETINNEIGVSDTYSASASEDNSYTAEEFNGKIVSEVTFSGLNLINEKLVRQFIKTRRDSVFNAELIQNDLQNIYNMGYFADNMYVEPELLNDDTVKLSFILQENVTVTKTEIKGNTVLSDAEINQFVTPLENLPQNLNLINEAIDKINNYYKDKGYILAKVTNVDDTKDGLLSFTISEGVIDRIKIDGNKKTKDYIIQRNIMTRAGSVYNEEYIKKDIAKIYETQIFDEVERKIEPSSKKEGEYIVTIKVTEGTQNSISIGGGVDNALGGFGQISYNEKNLFGKNQKLSISGMLGSGLLLSDMSIKNRMNWNIELNFLEPYFLNENNSLSAKMYYRDLGSYQIPLAIERRLGFNTMLEHKVRNYDNLTANLSLGYEYIHLKEGDLSKIRSVYDSYHIDFSNRKKQLEAGSFFNIAPGIKYSTLDDEIMPRQGVIAKANFIESVGISNVHRTSGRLIGSITKYIPVASKSTLLVGAKGGTKIHGHDMPEVMAFRLGGPYTIRGFRMNGVGTGESFIMASAELQTPIPYLDRFKYEFLKNLRIAFFVDAGRVFEPTLTSTLYDRPLSAITAGVGLRINIPGLGPISVDYGLPLTNTGKCSSQHGYFTFGTGGLYDSY